MPFQIIRNDITKVKADIIVNTANPQPMIGSGTDSAIYNAAGVDELLAERKKIGNIEPGEAVVTPAFGLSAKYIIHTVGPAWEDGNHGEKDILRSCYENSLKLAAELNAQSIAFPLIATGVYGFPKDAALDIALSAIGKFLLTHEMTVILVVFGRASFVLSEKLVGSIDAYLDEHQIQMLESEEYKRGKDYEVFRRDPDYINSVCMNLLQIGEYAGRLSERFAEETGAEMDWRQMKSMRNLFAHNYGQMKTDVVWVTVMEDLPALADFCRRILHDKKNEQE